MSINLNLHRWAEMWSEIDKKSPQKKYISDNGQSYRELELLNLDQMTEKSFKPTPLEDCVKLTRNLALSSKLEHSLTHAKDLSTLSTSYQNLSTKLKQRQFVLSLKIAAVFSFVLIGLIPYLIFRHINKKINEKTISLDKLVSDLKTDQVLDVPRNQNVEENALKNMKEWFDECAEMRTDVALKESGEKALRTMVKNVAPLRSEAHIKDAPSYVTDFVKDADRGISFKRSDCTVIDKEPVLATLGDGEKAVKQQAAALNFLLTTPNDLKWRYVLQAIITQGPLIDADLSGYLNTQLSQLKLFEDHTSHSYALRVQSNSHLPIELIINRTPNADICSVRVIAKVNLSLVQFKTMPEKTDLSSVVAVIKKHLSNHELRFIVELDNEEQPIITKLSRIANLCSDMDQ